MPMAFDENIYDKWTNSLLDQLPQTTSVQSWPPINVATTAEVAAPVNEAIPCFGSDLDSLDSFGDEPIPLNQNEDTLSNSSGYHYGSQICNTDQPSPGAADSTASEGSPGACAGEFDNSDKASRKTNPHKLPPCKVCGAQATGYHYGVNSCEACKGFFHRSLLRKKPYKCYKSVKCEIKPGKRNVCGHCRYNKCLEVGMSKDGIKTGRYTYEKRTQDILEIKKEHVQKAEAKEKELESSHQLNLENFIERLVIAKEKLLSDVELIQKTDHVITAVHPEAPNKLLYIPYETQETAQEESDGGTMWRKWASVVENTGGVRRVIKFVKTIPGFRDLEMSDQIQLIKHSFCEIWVIARHKFFDIYEKRYNNKVGFSFDVVRALGDAESGTLLNVASRLKILNLSEEETSLMLAFVIFFSDRCVLVNPDKVDRIQETILEALQYNLHKYHQDDKARFGKIMSIFIELRSMTEFYHHLSDRALSNIGDIAPLLWEIINLA